MTKELSIPGALTSTGLVLPKNITIEKWLEIGRTLKSIDVALLWWWGDWLNFGEQTYGEKYSQALEGSDYEYGTLRNAGWVSSQIEMSRRRDNLSWSHHSEVASLPAAQADKWLDKAEKKGWAQKELRRAVQKEKHQKLLETKLSDLDGEYDVVVIDPPWPMEKIERDCRPNQHGFDYPTMTEEDIAEKAPPCAKNCHVWLWTTHKFLPMAFRLLESWGLSYVCCYVWHKPGGFQPVGLPQYNCEFALYARKGTPVFATTKKSPVCFDAPRGKHSEKPQDFYDYVRRVTQGKRKDMYNRRPISGFEGWGLESDAR